MVRKDIFEDVVSGLVDCQYISDLHSMVEHKNGLEILNVLEEFDYDDYTIKQWNELYGYLFKDEMSFQSSQEAYDCILALLKK